MRKHLHEVFPCGCEYEMLEVDGKLITLRLQTCSICMAMSGLSIENHIDEQLAQLDLLIPRETDRPPD